jgi:hypothetical protein
MAEIRYNTPGVYFHFGNRKVLRAVLPKKDLSAERILHVLPHDIGEGVEAYIEIDKIQHLFYRVPWKEETQN